LNNAEARFLVTSPQFVDKAREAAEQSKVEELFVFVRRKRHTVRFALAKRW